MTSKGEILALAEECLIGIDGYLIGSDRSPATARASFENTSEDILEQVNRSRRWVKRFVQRRTLNRSLTTQIMAVRCETETKLPISRGCFIVACLLEGVQIRQISGDNPDGFTNLSHKLLPGHLPGVF